METNQKIGLAILVALVIYLVITYYRTQQAQEVTPDTTPDTGSMPGDYVPSDYVPPPPVPDVPDVAMPSAWQCVSNPEGTGYGILRKEVSGDVACAGFDGKGCDWVNSSSLSDCRSRLDTYSHVYKPVICGDMHKSLYGTTGYDTEGHWCNWNF